ncbi:hypothetical protein D9M73_281810 [compost metagenome]
MRRVDEEHLDLAGRDAGEPGDSLLRVFGADQHYRVEVAGQHQVLQQFDVAVRQKIVGSTYRGLPDPGQFFVVALFRCMNDRMLAHASLPLG